MATSSSTPTPQIDASCRLPLFGLFGGAACWLFLSSVFGLLASMTFHKASIFADSSVFTYGRAFPAGTHLLVYGFCIPAGLGVGLWLLARLGQVEVAQPLIISIGAHLWHLGVLVGLVAILAGQTSGFQWFELPRYAAAILFLSFLLMAIWIFVTYSRRTPAELYPSQWFVLAALFWFPWIFSSAILLLQLFPVQGVVQASVAWWFAGNLLNVWLVLAGLAATFYIVPKLTGQPLQSRYLALFAFWTILIFGTWTGIPQHAALPAWMPTLSGAISALYLIPVFAALSCVLLTNRGAKFSCRGGPLCFVRFGAWSLVFAGLLLAIGACPQFAKFTDYTWFGIGRTNLLLYGFFGMTTIGTIYHILPQLVGAERVCPNRIRANFWLMMIGSLLLAFPLVFGGVAQGLKLADPKVEFLVATNVALNAFRISSLGEFLLLVGNLLFLFNLVTAVWGYYFAILKPAYGSVTTPLQTAEVKS